MFVYRAEIAAFVSLFSDSHLHSESGYPEDLRHDAGEDRIGVESPESPSVTVVPALAEYSGGPLHKQAGEVLTVTKKQKSPKDRGEDC